VKKRPPPRWTRFAGDGCRKMRNNSAGRAIRPISLGGKNLFADSGARGRRAAIISTLIETAKLNNGEGVLRCTSLDLIHRSMSDYVIHSTAGIIGEVDSILSRMHSTGCAGASEARVLDNIDPLAKLAAKR
jgi:hypothetical protein